MTKAQVANLSRETWIPKPKELFGHETMESLHGFVTVLRDHATCLDKPKRRSGDAFYYLADLRATVADAPAFWTAAGSEAPRRFGFSARGEQNAGVLRVYRRKSKAPSPLRSAGALHNLAELETLPANGKRGAPPFWNAAGFSLQVRQGCKTCDTSAQKNHSPNGE